VDREAQFLNIALNRINPFGNSAQLVGESRNCNEPKAIEHPQRGVDRYDAIMERDCLGAHLGDRRCKIVTDNSSQRC
jgi:hypothetical protein